MAGFDFLLTNAPPAAAPSAVAPRLADSPVAPPRITSSAALHGALPALARQDRELINALAAVHLQYGKPKEALALLQLTNRLWPQDAQSLRLMTQAFIAIEDYASAEMTETALRRVAPMERPNRIDLLRQAIIHFGRLRLAEARASLMACFAAGRS